MVEQKAKQMTPSRHIKMGVFKKINGGKEYGN